MFRFVLLFSLFMVVGCSSVEVKSPVYVPVNGKVNVVSRSEKVGSVSEVLRKQKVQGKSVGVKYDVKILGQLNLSDVVRYFADVMGMMFVPPTFETSVVDVDIVGKFSMDDILTLLDTVAVNRSCSVRANGLVLELVKNEDTKDLYEYFKYVEVSYRANEYNSLVGSVRVLYLDTGILLLGKKAEVLLLSELLRKIDVDLLSGSELRLVGYGRRVTDVVRMSLEKIGIRVFFYDVSEDSSLLVMKDTKYLDRVLDMLKSVSDKISGSVFVLRVYASDVEELTKNVKMLYPGILFTRNMDSFVFKDYQSYKTVEKLFRKLDVVERQVFLKYYLLDIQSRDTLDLGADINYKDSQFSAISNLRNPVGLGIFGSYQEFKAYFNILMQKYDGRLLINPSMVLRNNTESSLNFGQKIPTLGAKSESTGGAIVQNVQYTDVGVGIKSKVKVVGDVVYVDLRVFNSSVLEGVGVEGNPLFSSDTVDLSLVVKTGSVSVVAGLKRYIDEESSRITLSPQTWFRRKEKREFLLCLYAEEVGLTNVIDYNFEEQFLN